VQKPGELNIWYGSDRRVVVYPTTNNQLLNFVCIHPEAESEAGSDTWNKGASLDQMLKIYEGFDPAIVALISKADRESLKAWKLLDMEVMSSWAMLHIRLRRIKDRVLDRRLKMLRLWVLYFLVM